MTSTLLRQWFLVSAMTLLTGQAAFAAEDATDDKFLLRYQFRAGEELRWKVTHLATTETRIRGNTQSSTSRSVSTKRWRVEETAEEGQYKVTHYVDDVDMWQKLSDRPEVRYNSETDDVIPREYQAVAQTLGVPLTVVVVTDDGRMIKRESGTGQPAFGLGDMVMMLPPKPVAVGGKWHEPAEIQIRQPDQPLRRIKIRKLYQLKKVHSGVATIAVKTEVLTPIRDASLKAQLVQQIVNGVVKFDVDAGQVLFKQMDWDEEVIGFSGNESLMQYQARFTEELLPAAARTASRPQRDQPEPASR